MTVSRDATRYFGCPRNSFNVGNASCAATTRGLILALMLCAVVAGSSSAWADKPWLTPEEYDSLAIVVDEDAPEPERIAATTFQSSFEAAFGVLPPVVFSDDGHASTVWIGEAARRAFPEETSAPFAQPDAFIVKTIGDVSSDRRHLLLLGGSPRATLYAYWYVFEHVLGARYFGPGMVQWPEGPVPIPAIDYRWTVDFRHRDVSYFAYMNDPMYALLNRLNGHWSGVPDERGGHDRYVRGNIGYGHTFHYFVPPGEYFATHPEYFAEIDGERVAEAQLCLTNPDVLRITIDKVRALLRNAKPNERILSVSQMDYFWFDSWCTCDACRAIDEREESHSGTIIHFVNQVAEAIAPEFPDALIDTFAYLYSRKPPKHLKVRDNVVVRLCSMELDHSLPVYDRRSPENRKFVRDLKRWSAISRNLFIWEYTQNWFAYQAPHPNIQVIQPNLAWYAKHGVDGVYAQASALSPHSDFDLLKAYLIGNALSDPRRDWREGYDEFLAYYYGDAAPFIDAYLTLMHERVRDPDVFMGFVDDLQWVDAELLAQAETIFDAAFQAVDDPVIEERLRYAYIPVQFAALVCPPQVRLRPEGYTFRRPPSQSLDDYMSMIRGYGVTHLNDYPVEALRQRMHGTTPPRYSVASIARIENDRYLLWVVPERSGAVLRWRDKRTGRDWLHGFNHVLDAGNRMQEWAATEPDRWVDPFPVEAAYRVLEQSSTRMVLETTLENGLRLRRTMRLSDDELSVQLDVTNTSEEPLVPKAAVYAGFDAGDFSRGDLWIAREEAWGKGAWARSESGGFKDGLDAQAIAVRFPRDGWTVMLRGGATGGSELRYRYAPDAGVLRLGAEVSRDVLAPGATRVLQLRYALTRTRPSKMPVTAP